MADMAPGTDTSADLNRNKQIAAIANALLNNFPRVFGTFKLAAAAATTVAQPEVKSNSFVAFVPTNAAAATLMSGSKSLYLSALTAGASFAVATADGTNPAGTETFSYWLINPV